MKQVDTHALKQLSIPNHTYTYTPINLHILPTHTLECATQILVWILPHNIVNIVHLNIKVNSVTASKEPPMR